MDNDGNLNADTLTRSWGPLSCYLSATIISFYSIVMNSLMSQGSGISRFLEAEKKKKKLVLAWTVFSLLWLLCSTCSTATSCHYPAALYSHRRVLDRRSTGHNQQHVQLYAKEMCCTIWGKLWSHQILMGFLIHVTEHKTFVLSVKEDYFLFLMWSEGAGHRQTLNNKAAYINSH